jgi:adenylate kinase
MRHNQHKQSNTITMMKSVAFLFLVIFPLDTLAFLPSPWPSAQQQSQLQRHPQTLPTANAWGVTPGRSLPTSAVRSPLHGSYTRRGHSNTRIFSSINIIIAGAPASGKGTQCEIIKEKFGVVHLSTGDMLRAAVAAGTEVGKMAKGYMDSGKLVPDEVIIGIVKERLNEDDCKRQGWLLDGFPRTQAQAMALEEAGVSADCFLFLDVPDEVLVERVVGRRTDPVTGKIYHMTFSPPEDDEVSQRLEQRSDDTEEKVKVRLEQFHTNVDSVKDSYTEIMVAIDGNQAPSEVSRTIMETIEKMKAAKA